MSKSNAKDPADEKVRKLPIEQIKSSLPEAAEQDVPEEQERKLESLPSDCDDYSHISLISGVSECKTLNLRIPDRIMSFLEYDCWMVTCEKKSYRLPQKWSVARILHEYLIWFVNNHAFKKKPEVVTLQNGEVFETFDPLTSIELVKTC